MPPDPVDVADEPRPGPTVVQRGALVVSAAQDYENASEAYDLEDENYTPHGAFSLAFIRTLKRSRPDDPVDRLFLTSTALLQSDGYIQTPILSGRPERLGASLFGVASSDAPEPIAVSVSGMKEDGTIELRGGWAAGLNVGCELVKSDAGKNEKAPKISVTGVSGMGRCVANVIEGDPKQVKPGDLFELHRWSAGQQDPLQVWPTPSSLGYADISAVATEMLKLRDKPSVTWIEDPTDARADYAMFWGGTAWQITGPDGTATDLGVKPGAARVASLITNAPGGKTSFFLYLPLPSDIRAKEGIWPRRSVGARRTTKQGSPASSMTGNALRLRL